MLSKISTFWIILTALLLTNAAVLGLMAFNAIQTTGATVEEEQIVQLSARVDAHASAIDERLNAFANATRLAATQAKELLLSPEEQLTPEEMEIAWKKYARDANGVLGVDAWYTNEYLPIHNDNLQSNVFLNKNTELTPELQQEIVITEKLNPLFESIRSSKIGTQWIYLTLANGMMRLYPWAGNESYPVDWEPQTISFYTVADNVRDPEHKSVWTMPYNDFAGAGLMVTNSYPIYDGDHLIGVMSHDFLIKDLQQQVLGFKVGKEGFAFLLDKEGNIIAHPGYAPEDTALGEELNIKLSDREPWIAGAIDQMLSLGQSSTTITDQNGKAWVMVYTRIQATDWHLGLMQPHLEIIQPALNIANELRIVTVGLIILAVIVSIILARWISHPVIQLSHSAHSIEASVDSMDISLGGQAEAQAVVVPRIRGTREISNLVTVFGQMVTALQKRINELGSTYVLAQTITSTIDYDQTLKTILEAMRRTLDADSADITVVQDQKQVVAAWSGEAHLQDLRGRQTPLGQGLSGQVMETKSVLWISTPEQVPADLEESAVAEFKQRSVYSFLGAPLISGKELIGVLTLENHCQTGFSEDSRRQLQRLTALASIAIGNAIQVRQREQALKDQIRELKIEIDQAKKARQVEEIVESDFFVKLQADAARMRNRKRPNEPEE